MWWLVSLALASEPVTALFVTCGEGTEHRPR